MTSLLTYLCREQVFVVDLFLDPLHELGDVLQPHTRSGEGEGGGEWGEREWGTGRDTVKVFGPRLCCRRKRPISFYLTLDNTHG